MDENHLAKNLGYLCSYYPSIAEACRKLCINRQQFNKYLSGQTRPSRRNMRQICDFFGVEEAEMLLPPARFAEIIQLRPRVETRAPASPETRALTRLLQSSREVPDRYLGYYFRYFYSFAFPGYVTRSFIRMYRANGHVYWKNIEFVWRRDRDRRPRQVFKYAGLVTLIAERLYVFEEEEVLKNLVTQTILYPSYTSWVGQLRGIQTATSSQRGRQPAASSVLLVYLGASVNIRRSLERCGQFPEDAPEIDPDIRARIVNRITKSTHVLTVTPEA